MVKERESVWDKMKPKESVERILEQVPKTRTDLLRDAARSARAPGKRVSKTGKVYWETRQNRSDKLKSNL